MTRLWILLAVSLVIAQIIDNRDRSKQHLKPPGREHFVTFLLILVLGFFCGLRTWGNDTSTYLQMFEQIPLLDNYIGSSKQYDFSGGTGFGAMTSLLKTCGLSPQDYLMFFAFATIIPYVLFVRRYSKSMVFGVFLMFTTGFYTFSMAAIKQCMATGLCLMAVSCALDGKWIRYGLWIFAAVLFHPYALVYLLVPFLMFKPWGIRTFLCIIAFVAAGFGLESLLGTVLSITDMMGATYTADSFTGEGVNIFRVAVCFVPLILACMFGKPLFAKTTREEDLMFNMAMVNALIMFVGLFGTANYFARLANYFLPSQVIVLPWILSRAHPKDQVWLTPACVVGYLGYFYYENAIIRPFDNGYAQMSFWSYLDSLF